jgi:hypothetical protein
MHTETGERVIHMTAVSKKLKVAMLVIVAFIALVTIFEYRTIELGAFSLGVKTTGLFCKR